MSSVEECRKQLIKNGTNLNEPFLFVSYKREDAEKVYPFVLELQKRGVNLWIDTNMVANVGDSWQKPAFDAIFEMNCASILFFASLRSMRSVPCLAEMMYAGTEMCADRHEDTFKILSVDIDNIISGYASVNNFIRQHKRELDVILDQRALEGIFTDDVFDVESDRFKFISRLRTEFEVAKNIAKITGLSDEKTILAQNADQIIESCTKTILNISPVKAPERAKEATPSGSSTGSIQDAAKKMNQNTGNGSSLWGQRIAYDKPQPAEDDKTPENKLKGKNVETITLSDGSTYTGERVNGKYHGYGVYCFASGAKYEGEFYEGQIHGRGTYYYTSGSRYEGEFVAGKKCGVGTMYYGDGRLYEGEYKDDKINGRGRFRTKSGDIYEGEFKDGAYHGYGTYTHTNGAKYEGFYENSKLHGKGKYTYEDGSTYEGDYFQGVKKGHGVYITKSGIRHEGEYAEGKRNGQGVMTYPDGRRYEGEFKNDKFHGFGTYRTAKGDVYEGMFVEHHYEGPGKYTFANGDYYEGYFANGKRGGYGKFTYAAGGYSEGEWEDDKLRDGERHRMVNGVLKSEKVKNFQVVTE
ncbi:MAG: TIR domain-containing protein [Acetatifactor sp.]|nr:TIR domain-containing protein [Acetatifactor sp.]